MPPNKPNRQQLLRTYLDYVYSLDYKERPPDSDTFLNDPDFLGDLTDKGKMVYPIWRRNLKVSFREDSKYLIVLTGAIGTGKSRAAIYGILLGMCRILCLKEPWAKFGLAPGAQMSVVFFNLTKSQSESVSYKTFQEHLIKSPWFREHGVIGGSELNPKVEFPLFKYTFASPYVPGFGAQGENPILALLDEVDSPESSEVQREKVLSAYENNRRRLESRFVIRGETLGRFYLVASKQKRLAFLNAFIAKYKNSKNVMVVDIPLWEAKPASLYCGKKFSVSVGDIYNPPKVLKTEEDIQSVTRAGYQILQVPIEYLDDFEKDAIGSLRDLGGVSVSQIRVSKLFPSESLLSKCYENVPNPVRQLTIEVGLQDNIDLLNFIDLKLLRVPRNVPRFIHVDFAFSGDGDAAGFAMSCVEGWKKKNVEQRDGTFQTVKSPAAHTDFAMRIKGKPGDKIPLHLIRKMILDLKEVYKYNIKECTFDLAIATESDKQILERAGIACDHFSVDKNPQYYRDFSTNLVAEGRWSTPYHPYLHFELKNLEEDPEKNKIDHPKEVAEIEILEDGDTREIVLVGSKDLADATCASVINAIQKSTAPPDIEVMTELMSKVQSKPTDFTGLWWVDANVEHKEEEKSKPQGNPNATYLDILKKSRRLHQGF